MRGRAHFSIGAMVATVVVLTTLSLVTAIAQPLQWNPPCPVANVINTTTCTAQLTLSSGGPAGSIAPVTVQPCTSALITAPTGVVISGIITKAGAFRLMAQPGPIAPPVSECGPIVPAFVAPANGWVKGVILGPAGCCFDIYFYRNNDPNYPCTIILYPGTPACTP